MKKKILFLYCGGTIGQVLKDIEVNGVMQSVLAAPEGSEEFEVACRQALTQVKEVDDMEIVFELFTTKDSTNMQPHDWEQIARRIQKAQDDESYDAVGIAHGTDTMAYTSTALALALHGTDPTRSGLAIPVVITGSQNSIHTIGGDGQFNLQNLFRVMSESIDHNIADVLVSFWSRVLLGSRVVKVNEREFDAFRSPNYPDVGTINSLGVTLRPDLVKSRSSASYRMWLAPLFASDTLSFDVSPGLRPETVLRCLETESFSALILKSLAESNVPNEGEYNFLPLIETVSKRNIPVIISTRFINGQVGIAHYEVGARAVEAGGIPGLDHTSVAVEVKARWLIGNQVCNSVEGFRKAYMTSYGGEVTV